MVKDPIALERCGVCTNAFEYDRDPAASRVLFPDGNGFVCKGCAADVPITEVATSYDPRLQELTITWGSQRITLLLEELVQIVEQFPDLRARLVASLAQNSPFALPGGDE